MSNLPDSARLKFSFSIIEFNLNNIIEFNLNKILVPRPELIDKDASAKNRSWYEHSGGEWLPVKDMKIAVV